jgi:hypothetical protein
MLYQGSYPNGHFKTFRRFSTLAAAKAYVEENMAESMYIVELKARTKLVKEPSLQLITVE